jgi:hypothetical protein
MKRAKLVICLGLLESACSKHGNWTGYELEANGKMVISGSFASEDECRAEQVHVSTNRHWICAKNCRKKFEDILTDCSAVHQVR